MIDYIGVLQERVYLYYLVQIAGAGQLALVLASFGVPLVLKWKEDFGKLSALNRAIFWTYGAYIASTNTAMGLLSVWKAEWLLSRTGLAACVCGFIGAWWGVRLLIQLFCFRRHSPRGWFYQTADIGFTCLFIYLAVVYVKLAWWNLAAGNI